MSSWGKLQGGPGWSQVVLSAPPEAQGDTLSIFLSQQSQSRAAWTIQVFAYIADGSYSMGQVRCRVPTVAGEPAARLVAIACCPGAQGWAVQCHSDTIGEQADLFLRSSRLGGTLPGVTAVTHGAANPTAPRSSSVTLGVGPVSPQLAPLGAQVWRLSGSMDQAATPNTEAWIMVFDQPAAPVAGDVPIWQGHVGQIVVPAFGASAPDGSTWSFDPGPLGRSVTAGLWVGVSSAPSAFAPVAGITTSIQAELTLP